MLACDHITGYYEFGGIIMRVSTLHEDTHSFCEAFRTDRYEPAVEIVTDIKDISSEKEMLGHEQGAAASDCPFTDGFLETIAVYRKIAELMPVVADSVVIHGSCVAVDGESFLFSADSGVGKSTHTRLWRELLGKRAVMINDDKPIIGIRDGQVRAYGTPWAGKHRLFADISAPLKGVCFIVRSKENRIQRMEPHEAFINLVRQTYRPSSSQAFSKTVKILDYIAGKTNVWKMGCNTEPDAARIAYETMKGQKI